jgi:hypothetical protein
VTSRGFVGGESHPVELDLHAPYDVARWRPFFGWAPAIPHLIITAAIGSVIPATVIIAWFSILFTGGMPKGIFDFQALYLRYSWRTMSYAFGLQEQPPPYEFELRVDDDGHHPATLSLPYPDELSRAMIWAKWFMLVPHVIALAFVGIAVGFAWFVGVLAVLFTGAWPTSIRDFIVGYARWTNRVNAYGYLMTDEYPPFSTRS